MRVINYKIRLWMLPIAILFGAGIACRLPLQVPQPPGPPIPVSTEAFDSFKDKLNQAARLVHAGETVDISLSEEELTSAFAFYLQDQTDTNFTDPQVYLIDGEIQVFGNYQTSDSSVPLRVVFDPTVDELGIPHIDIVAVDFGRFSAPEALLTRIQGGLDNVWNELVDAAGDRLQVNTIDAADGALTIQGQVR
jgi:hypothetical protein